MDKNEESASLIRRAALLRLLAAGFLYPDAALKQRLLQDIAAMPAHDAAAPALAALERAWSMADEESLKAQSDAPLASVLSAKAQSGHPWPAPLASVLSATEEYSRLFIGGDAIVLHETSYSGTGRSTELADINGFYLAFGFDLRADQHEVADHLGVELEFYSLLLLKQAYALEQGWPDKFEITRDAAKAFLTDHLGRWVDKVHERAIERQAAPIYQALFEAAAAAVQRECQAFAVRPAPLMCSGPDFMQDAAFVCPMGQTSAEPPADAAAH